jgi:pullulanase/glycogen debranching enzyme
MDRGSVKLAPSILEADFARLGEQVAEAERARADRIHVDVAYWEPLRFEIPAVREAWEPWRRCVDTFRDSPEDIVDWADGPVVHGPTYHVQPRSIVVLVARTSGRDEAGRLPANADPAQPTRDGPGQ